MSIIINDNLYTTDENEILCPDLYNLKSISMKEKLKQIVVIFITITQSASMIFFKVAEYIKEKEGKLWKKSTNTITKKN